MHYLAPKVGFGLHFISTIDRRPSGRSGKAAGGGSKLGWGLPAYLLSIR